VDGHRTDRRYNRQLWWRTLYLGDFTAPLVTTDAARTYRTTISLDLGDCGLPL